MPEQGHQKEPQWSVVSFEKKQSVAVMDLILYEQLTKKKKKKKNGTIHFPRHNRT